MKVEAVCSGQPDICPTVIAVGDLGEVFRHVQLVEVKSVGLSGRTATDEDGNIASCPVCDTALVVLRPTPADAKLALGRIVTTWGVRKLFGIEIDAEHPEGTDAERFNEYQSIVGGWIQRHARGDWGALGEDDRSANKTALHIGDDGQAQGIVMSVWNHNDSVVWIITERGRHETTIMLPHER